jgi:hypothetical protein
LRFLFKFQMSKLIFFIILTLFFTCLAKKIMNLTLEDDWFVIIFTTEGKLLKLNILAQIKCVNYGSFENNFLTKVNHLFTFKFNSTNLPKYNLI